MFLQRLSFFCLTLLIIFKSINSKLLPNEKPFETKCGPETKDCYLSQDDSSSNQTNFSFKQTCLFVCISDPDCVRLGFDRSKIKCSCACQLCPNGLIYPSGVRDHTNATLLSIDDINAQCPHAKAPCPY